MNGRRIPDLPTDRQTQIACALFYLTIEQARSVTFLFLNEHYGAGLALTRSVLEACCRGIWIKHHAKTETIETFSSNKFPDMRTLIEKTMSRILDPQGNMNDFFIQVYKRLSEYTHGGVHMIKMQLSKTGLVSEYSLEDVKEALRVSDGMQLQAAAELLEFALKETDDQCEQLQADVKKIKDLFRHFSGGIDL